MKGLFLSHCTAGGWAFEIQIADKYLCHSWLERGETVGKRRQKTHADLIACQVGKYFIFHKGLAAKKIPGSRKTYLRSLGKQYRGSTQVEGSSTAVKAVDHAMIGRGARGTFVIDWNLFCPWLQGAMYLMGTYTNDLIAFHNKKN